MNSYFKSIMTVKSTAVLIVISLFSIALTVARSVMTGEPAYYFLMWNLFLAVIPWLAASMLYLHRSAGKVTFILLGGIWLLFFPNAPYIFTDLFHFGNSSSAPLWYDLILILTYSFAGILFGFVSLQMIETKLTLIFGMKRTWVFSIFVLYLSSFGIFIGRYLRWNSWDLFTNPDSVLGDIVIRVFLPVEYPRTWLFTILFGTLFSLFYWGFKEFGKELPSQTKQ